MVWLMMNDCPVTQLFSVMLSEVECSERQRTEWNAAEASHVFRDFLWRVRCFGCVTLRETSLSMTLRGSDGKEMRRTAQQDLERTSE